jgi:hypothetical protein
VNANDAHDLGVQPAVRPNHRPLKGKTWNVTTTAITNDTGVLIGYTGAWDNADAEVNANAAHDPGIQPAVRPNHRPLKGKTWNGTATAITNDTGVLIGYTGAWDNADTEEASSDISCDDLDDLAIGQGKKKRCRKGGKTYILSCLGYCHWSQARTRMPSRSHPGVLRPRVVGGIEVDVHDILSAADRAEVNGHLRTMPQNAGAAQDAEGGEVGGDDDETEDDESHSADLHERIPAQQNLMDSVLPFVPPTSWIVMGHPPSSDTLKPFQWKGKRLGMKFEGGWSTASYKRTCTRKEAPEGYHLFRYKDKGTKDIAHMLDLEDYGVTKKWVIITEISKEVENNAILQCVSKAVCTSTTSCHWRIINRRW